MLPLVSTCKIPDGLAVPHEIDHFVLARSCEHLDVYIYATGATCNWSIEIKYNIIRSLSSCSL